MKLKKQTTATLALLLIAASVMFFNVQSTNAQMPADQFNSLVETIAGRLQMKPDDVRAVFEEMKVEREAEQKKHLDEQLSALVTKGELTEAQKQAVLAKHAELAGKHQEMMNKTPEERRALMKTHHKELEAWAKEQGISLEVLKGIGIGQLKPWKRGSREGQPE